MKKNIRQTITALVSHIIAVISLMMLVLVVTDYFNRPMAFINNKYTKMLMCLLAVLCIYQSICVIRFLRKQKMDEYKETEKNQRNNTEPIN